MIKYSVIVPIYNMEKYLNECIDSIVNQNRTDIEIILINDGSTDKSLNICNEYKKSYEYIKVIDKKNSGSMDSWIKGVEASSGKYICFIDSDDKIDKRYFEIIDKYANKNYDIIVFDFYKMYKENIKRCKVNNIMYGEMVESELEDLQKNYYNKNEIYSFYRWDKVIKSEIIKKCVQDIQCRCVYFEDHPISFLNLLNAKSIYYINDALYYYRIRKSSVSHKINEKVFDDNLIVESEMNRIATDKKYDEVQKYKIYLYFLYQYARWSLKSTENYNLKKVRYKDIKNIDSINKKLVLLLYKFNCKYLYNIIYKLKNRSENKNIEYFFD